MIAYISGNVLDLENNAIIVENNGVGFEINCTRAVLRRAEVGKPISLSVYLAVRDDGLFLYGFDSAREKAMFLKLISVSGIGPKMGMTVLSGMGLSQLAYSIASSDVKQLTSIKGLGKKTAERIILELREAVSKNDFASSNAASTAAVCTGDDENAVLALMSLGYTKFESESAVEIAKGSGAGGLEAIITFALKSLAKAIV